MQNVLSKHFNLFFICLLSGIVSFTQPKQKKVVFIIVDGIPADVVERVSTPHLDAIAKEGFYTRAYVGGEKNGYSQTPTISAVGYNSLLTGTWVNKHNVWDNDIKEPNYNYPTIFRLLKTQYPNKKTAIFSSWTDNRTRLVGEGLAATGNIQLDYRFDGYELDTIRFPHDKEKGYMHKIDEQVVNDASKTLATEGPDLSWVYLEYTDDMAHRYGDGDQFYKSVETMDNQIGRIWNALQQRQKKYKEDWLIVITTDHGRDEQSGKGHGGHSDRQRSTWIVTNHPAPNNYVQYYKPAIVDIMPTIVRFMNIQIPDAVMKEVDGIPMIGNVSITHPEIIYTQGHLDISWKPLEEKGNVKIWLTGTNNIKSGGVDQYQLMQVVPLKTGHAWIDVQNNSSTFYKIVLEAPGNVVNKWVMSKEVKSK